MNQHSNAVEWQGKGFLLIGPPDSGKSELSMQLIERGAILVADDQVLLSEENGIWIARPHEVLQGKLKLRGQGILDVAWKPQTIVAHIFCSPLPAFALSKPPQIGLPFITLHFHEKNAVSQVEHTLQV